MVQSLIDTVSFFEWSLTYLFYSSPTSPPASHPMQKYPPRSTWLRPHLCLRKKPELLERRQLRARLSCDVQLHNLTGWPIRRNLRTEWTSIQSFVVSASALTQMLSLLKLRTCLPSSSTLLKSDHPNSSRRASLLSKTILKMLPPLEIAKDSQEPRTCSSSSIAESKSPLTLRAGESRKLTPTLSP